MKTCPKCLGDGFTGWTQNKFKNKNRLYKKICTLCLGSGEVDWITNATKSQPKIKDAMILIGDDISKRLGNYCFSSGMLQTHYVNEEFHKIRNIEEKWKHVRMVSLI